MEKRTIFDIMRSGEEVDRVSNDMTEFDEALRTCAERIMVYNTAVMTPDDRRRYLSETLGVQIGKGSVINPPFHCDLGFNIKVGNNSGINYGCILLDCAEIILEDNVFVGPGTKIITAGHPLDPVKRRNLSSVNEPVHLKKDSWVGAGAIILPGVTVGERSVVGAGSVVTKDVPPDTVVVGNPARVIRNL